ncbi:XopAW family type III secretion system calcium-binding effector [Variovorax sp. Sphag1AA]|uniref:XopAW family type III secretion system calcium-binding effector n=1 Tax=Variovorax sp. Sphag1AA TaxID=2587027 RepID=UPI001619E233|nr:XopAW family type III secretion system calcium-binding effector [Variovorax sp. Sphag1AA]MBB3181712.1 Ca2+-binding EF-hand superfamily protein [Variovorax sp. Sphag1AA]
MSSISGISSASSAWSNMSAMRSQMQAKMFAKADADGSGGVDQTELQGVLDAVAGKTGVASSTSTAELFTKMDSDGDGSLSSDELAQGMQGMMPPPPPSGDGSGGSDDLFSKVDSDGDGLVSKVEMQLFMSKMMSGDEADGASASTDTSKSDELFAKLDSDGDGSLSQSEFDAGRPEAGAQTAQAPSGAPPAGGGGGGGGAVSGVTTYDPLDTNEDGVVSLAERMAGNVSTDAVQALFNAIDTDGDSKISSAESSAFVKALSAQVDSTDVSQTGTLASSKLVELVQRAYAQVASASAAPTQGGTIDVTT